MYPCLDKFRLHTDIGSALASINKYCHGINSALNPADQSTYTLGFLWLCGSAYLNQTALHSSVLLCSKENPWSVDYVVYEPVRYFYTNQNVLTDQRYSKTFS